MVTDAVADLLLVSEPAGEENLRREGVADSRVVYVGNVMIDTLMAELPAAKALGAPRARGLDEGSYAYVTLHRPSNVDEAERLDEVLGLLEDDRFAAAGGVSGAPADAEAPRGDGALGAGRRGPRGSGCSSP